MMINIPKPKIVLYAIQCVPDLSVHMFGLWGVITIMHYYVNNVLHPKPHNH